jgi:ABC-2 type transport system ATP-binding protein
MKNEKLASLNVSSVSRSFGDLKVFKSLNWEARAGRITAIVGPNGAGKTTLFRMMAQILEPDSGTISVCSNLSEKKLSKEMLGFMPEERSLYKEVKVSALLSYWCELRGIERSKKKYVIQKWLSICNLNEKASELVSSLSKGNQQKVQIACCLLHEPEVIIFDEPFSGLDPVNQQWAVNLLTEQAENGKIVIVSAHQLELIERFTDKIYFLKDGELKLINQMHTPSNFHFELINTSSPEVLDSGYVRQIGSNTFQLATDIIPDDELYRLVGRIVLDSNIKILNQQSSIVDQYINLANGVRYER